MRISPIIAYFPDQATVCCLLLYGKEVIGKES
jgi:hypothetical protein